MHIRETQTENLLEELISGQLDVLLLALPITRKDVEVQVLFQDRFMLAAPAGSDGRGTGRMRPEALADEELLLLEEGHCLREQALSLCSFVRPEAMRSYGATSLATIMQLVANGYGVTLLPDMCCDVEARDPRIKLIRFTDPEPQRAIGLVWRKSSPRKSAFAELGTLITERCRPKGARGDRDE